MSHLTIKSSNNLDISLKYVPCVPLKKKNPKHWLFAASHIEDLLCLSDLLNWKLNIFWCFELLVKIRHYVKTPVWFNDGHFAAFHDPIIETDRINI